METILMMGLLVAVFYFLLIRPENKRKKQTEEMRSSLKKGDTITTIGGIVGNIVQINADTLVIETSEDRVRVEITKWAISNTGVQTSTDARKSTSKKKETAEEPAKVEEKSAEAEDAPAEETAVEEKKD